MFGWLRRNVKGSILRAEARARERVAFALGYSRGTRRSAFLKYDAASPNDPDNDEHWVRGVDSNSSDAANSPAVRKRIRLRARYEADNNSYLAGMVETLVNDTIGGGPRLQLSHEPLLPESVAKEAEADWARWMREADVAEALQVIDRAKRVDGECFGMLVSDPAVPGPVKTRLVPVEADQVSDPNASNDPENQDGVLLDAIGNVVGYRMLKSHPGAAGGGSAETADIPAEQMVHWYKRRRPGQHRGISDLVACLKLMPMLRRYVLATVRSAEFQAGPGGVMECSDENSGPDDSVLPEDVINFDRGGITALPYGFSFKGFDATQPNSNMDMFVRVILQEAGRGLGVPLVAALMNASGFNFASGRLDHLIYLKGRKVERAQFAARVLNPIKRAWWREWVAAKRHPNLPDDPAADFIFPGFEFLDIQKESRAYVNLMAEGVITPPDVWTMMGKDPEQAKREAEAWGRWRRDNGFGATAATETIIEDPSEGGDRRTHYGDVDNG